MHTLFRRFGYEAVLIHTDGEKLNWMWSDPPKNFEAEVIGEFRTKGYVRADGTSPFGEDVDVVSKRLWLTMSERGKKNELIPWIPNPRPY